MENRFADNGDGTVTDTLTKLVWKKEDSFHEFKKFITYRQAKKYLEKLNQEAFAGQSDWRLPSREEAHSLFYQDKSQKVMDKYEMELFIDRVFPDGCGWDTWTDHTRGKITAYTYSFASGTGGHKDVDDNLNSSLRPVRGEADPEVLKSFGKIKPRKGYFVSDQR
ncbi:MAG: DUF1566 domain-containing protein [Nitrospina sp.]|nr:DUF1566 domain-containing protein [Nitrospina sp.]